MFSASSAQRRKAQAQRLEIAGFHEDLVLDFCPPGHCADAMGFKIMGILKKFPFVRTWLGIKQDIRALRFSIKIQQYAAQESVTTQLLSHPKHSDLKRLNRYEAQVFSQVGEDGIISEIFARIGTTDKVFVEIGAADGTQNTTRYLLLKGWSGFWFDGSSHDIENMQTRFASQMSSGQLVGELEFFDAGNAPMILRKHKVPVEFDFLSIDVDRNTSWVWKALSDFRPRVAVIEYNSSIPPQDEWEMPYDPKAIWDYTVFFGASLLTLQKIGEAKGYALVGCDLSGTNAFFIRNDLVGDLFCKPFTAVNHYEPPRYWLLRTWGHPGYHK